MARISFSYLCPASWHFTVPSVSLCLRQRLALVLLLFAVFLLLIVAIKNLWHWKTDSRDRQFERYLARYRALEATDTKDPALSYGVVVDCGSSGSRVFVYYWPPHNGNPHHLLDIRQMRDHSSEPVVKKIKPGISTLAKTPEKANEYMKPLLTFAAAYVPKVKHKETPLYIMCTAGMRLLPDKQQEAILGDLVKDIPLEYDFLFSESQAEVISGKQEGVYAWIGINFVLGRFDHAEEEDALISVTLSGQEEPMVRKRTVGILDMGGASLQIAYEVPNSIPFSSPQQEEAAKSLLADFNLGCDVQHTKHVYRVYVNTFLGFGGNFARQRYEELVLNQTITHNRVKMPKGQKPTAGDMEKIMETLAKMELKLNKLDEIQKSQEELKLEMSGMKKDLSVVQQKADDNKRRMDGLEGDVKAIQRRDDIRGNSILTTQLDRLSFFLRFQNIEEVDQENLRELMVKLLSDYTGRNIDFMIWDVDLVYRVNSQYAILHGVPREVHVKFVRRETREEILRKQRQGALSYRGKEITILKQIPRQVRELRRKYYFLSNKLYLKGIGFRWLMPEGLMIFREGTRKKIGNVAEAKAYLEQHKALLGAENVETEEGEVLEVQGVGLEAAGAVGGEVGPEPRILRPRQK